MSPVRAFTFMTVIAFLYISAVGQTARERFWLAGRYDGNRVLVYFQGVKFKHTIPPNARRLPDAVVDGFFDQVELPADYIAHFQKGPDAEHFAMGDQYDLLMGDGRAVPVTVSALLGSESDEDVGNDSSIGAIATVNNRNDLLSSRGYYLLRRHQNVPDDIAKPGSDQVFASLVDEPVRSDIQNRMASLLTGRMKTMADADQRREAERVPPALAVQPFRVADGSLRYYVRAQWKSLGKKDDSSYLLAAWMTSQPALHILAVETTTANYGFESDLPKLLNVVDLGRGRTAIIVSSKGIDSRSLDLMEYRDGLSLRHMPSLDSVGCGE
ncbi:MAG: hypothetical protein DMG62_04440 [Acidobacteria bacterium]|nr:MAG: hypothetical protein DMG62_04440 [Acidobacteriota bacterium]